MNKFNKFEIVGLDEDVLITTYDSNEESIKELSDSTYYTYINMLEALLEKTDNDLEFYYENVENKCCINLTLFDTKIIIDKKTGKVFEEKLLNK